jgi:acyl-CoA synthetase (AMP-forming)/AMP-acid ligase II
VILQTTYAQLISTSLSYASGLTNSAHLSPGCTILLFSPNSTLYPSLLFAGQAAGLTVSTANSSYTPSELSHQIEVSGAEILLVGSDLVGVAREAAKERGLKEDKIYVLPGVDGKVVVPQGLRSYVQLQDIEGGQTFQPVQFTEEQTRTRVAYLPFSSGTTGKGKGVAISAANITAVSQQLNEVKGLFDGPEVVMGVLPLYHIVSCTLFYIAGLDRRACRAFLVDVKLGVRRWPDIPDLTQYGLIVLLHQTLLNSGTVVLLPKFDLPQFCSAVQKHKATVALIVPPIALGIAKHPIVDEYDLKSLRFMMSGAAPLSESLQQAVTERLGKKGGETKMLQGWGMTGEFLFRGSPASS